MLTEGELSWPLMPMMACLMACSSSLAQVADRYAQPHELKGVPKEVILYQYEGCPFCCKVKAFLDFHKVC